MPDFMTSQITIAEQQRKYWDEAAKDPDVERKYIADVDLGDCLDAIVNSLLAGSILEIGCGIGRLTEPIQENAPACQLHGIDISPEMLKLCPKSKVKYNLCDGIKIPYADESFDSVYSMLTFQHIDAAAFQRYIKETYRVLKDNGVFRFQFVEGNGDYGLVDHNHQYPDVKLWLQDNGLEVAAFEPHLVHPQWAWITAVKQ